MVRWRDNVPGRKAAAEDPEGEQQPLDVEVVHPGPVVEVVVRPVRVVGRRDHDEPNKILAVGAVGRLSM